MYTAVPIDEDGSYFGTFDTLGVRLRLRFPSSKMETKPKEKGRTKSEDMANDGRSQKAKQKRLISVISLFSLVLERRAAGEKAPSSAHREKAKSAFFLANNGVPLRSVCAAGHPRQRRNFYRRQGAFTHGNGISTCHCTRVLPLYLQLAAAVLSPLPYHQCGHDERQRCPVEQPTSRRASPSSP